MELFPAGGIELVAVELAPQVFDAEGVLADQQAGDVFMQVFSAALADAGEPGVGFDGDQDLAQVDPV